MPASLGFMMEAIFGIVIQHIIDIIIYFIGVAEAYECNCLQTDLIRLTLLLKV